MQPLHERAAIGGFVALRLTLNRSVHDPGSGLVLDLRRLAFLRYSHPAQGTAAVDLGTAADVSQIAAALRLAGLQRVRACQGAS